MYIHTYIKIYTQNKNRSAICQATKMNVGIYICVNLSIYTYTHEYIHKYIYKQKLFLIKMNPT